MNKIFRVSNSTGADAPCGLGVLHLHVTGSDIIITKPGRSLNDAADSY